jgi:hypothetical protein
MRRPRFRSEARLSGKDPAVWIIDNGDDELAPAIALRRHAEG